MAALLRVMSHFSLAMCPAPVSSRLCSCCSPTRPARDAACHPCARGEKRWHGQREPLWKTLHGHLGDVCMWCCAWPRVGGTHHLTSQQRLAHLAMGHSRPPAGAASSGCHLSIPTHPSEDTEEM